MKVYVTLTVNFPLEISDKFSDLGGWEPKSTSNDLKDECWKEVYEALGPALEKAGLDSDDYDCYVVTDEDGFIMAD